MAEERQNNPAGETPKSGSPLKDFLKHQRNAAEETYKAFESLVPPDFRTHSRAAKKEFLLGFKTLLEGVGEIVDREVNRARSAADDSGSGPSTTGKTKVKVEVS
jgi:hypothetical protein